MDQIGEHLGSYARVLGGAVGAVMVWIFGVPDALFFALLALAALDYLSGVCAAFVTRQLSSAVGMFGIAKKVGIFLVVAVSALIDSHALGAGGILRGAVIGFFIANEGLSVIENAGRMGIPIPQRLMDALRQLRGKDEN